MKNEYMNVNSLHIDWSCMVGDSYKLKDKNFRKEVLAFARKMLAPAKNKIIEIINILISENYKFAYKNRAYIAPSKETEGWIKEFENKGIYLPISVQAWLLEVGSVNMMGTHKNWIKTAYVSDISDNISSINDVWYTDPLVVEISKDYIAYLHNEWTYRIEDEGIENVGPFKIDFSPDYIHKANISGGLPYEISADCPVVDSLVLNERTCTSFTNYIRQSLLWGGFPGFKFIKDAKADIVDSIKKNGIFI